MQSGDVNTSVVLNARERTISCKETLWKIRVRNVVSTWKVECQLNEFYDKNIRYNIGLENRFEEMDFLRVVKPKKYTKNFQSAARDLFN